MDNSLWTNRDQAVLRCRNCGVELTDNTEQITIGEFIKKLIVLAIGFGICSMLVYFMINVSSSQDKNDLCIQYSHLMPVDNQNDLGQVFVQESVLFFEKNRS